MSESSAVKNIRSRKTGKYRLLAEGLLVGTLSGFLVAGFRLALIKADQVRMRLADLASSDMRGAVIVIGVLLVIAALIASLLKWEPECSGSGIPQVEGEMSGLIDMHAWRVLASKLAGCVLSIGGGMALGREGPCVQLGAMVGKAYSRGRKHLLTEERMLITCGAGAGLSAAFGAPLAGTIFALEEVQKNFSSLVLITTMGASGIADFVAANIVGIEPVFNFNIEKTIPLKLYWAVILLGILVGLLGVAYNKLIDLMQDVFAKIGSSYLRIATALGLSFFMMLVYPMALGSGSYLVIDIASGKFMLKALVLMLVVKLFFSTSCFGSGAPGGIFLPLLVLGSISGGIYSRFLEGFAGADSEYIAAFVVIAMAGLFSSIVRAPATGIILITEMTGDFSSLLALVTASLFAYVTASLCNSEPIYEQLLSKRVRREKRKSEDWTPEFENPSEKLILRGDVHVGSSMDGGKVEDMDLPNGCLIVSVMRNGEELIPSGSTRLAAGDHIEILCRKSDVSTTIEVIQKKCEDWQ